MNTPSDFGPIYAETLEGLTLGRFPTEPWNTFSNLIFLALALHLAFLTKLDRKKHPLIVCSLPVLLVGWVGGTIYHGTRSHSVWLIMDFVPIGLLSFAAALTFWYRLTNRWIHSVALLLLVLIVGRVAVEYLIVDRGIKISMGYVSFAISLLLPITLIVAKEARDLWVWLVMTALSFTTAIICRSLDKDHLLPMGTHFLWHLFGGLSVWFLMILVYRLNDNRRLVLDMNTTQARYFKSGL